MCIRDRYTYSPLVMPNSCAIITKSRTKWSDPQRITTTTIRTRTTGVQYSSRQRSSTVARYGHPADLLFTPRAHVNHVYVRTSSSTCARRHGWRAHVHGVKNKCGMTVNGPPYFRVELYKKSFHNHWGSVDPSNPAPLLNDAADAYTSKQTTSGTKIQSYNIFKLCANQQPAIDMHLLMSLQCMSMY